VVVVVLVAVFELVAAFDGVVAGVSVVVVLVVSFWLMVATDDLQPVKPVMATNVISSTAATVPVVPKADLFL